MSREDQPPEFDFLVFFYYNYEMEFIIGTFLNSVYKSSSSANITDVSGGLGPNAG